MNVLVFKTSMVGDGCRSTVAAAFSQFGDALRWSADLDDCDKILRVERVSRLERPVTAHDIIGVMQNAGFACEELA
ncbi:hypothetical protein [Spirosoma areae]